MNQLLFRKNMYDDLTQKQDEDLREMIQSRKNNLHILEWLKDSLVKDFEKEKLLVEDYESRYNTGKIGMKYFISPYFIEWRGMLKEQGRG